MVRYLGKEYDNVADIVKSKAHRNAEDVVRLVRFGEPEIAVSFARAFASELEGFLDGQSKGGSDAGN